MKEAERVRDGEVEVIDSSQSLHETAPERQGRTITFQGSIWQKSEISLQNQNESL